MNAGCGTSHHGLVNRVGGLIRKDAGGQAGDHPDHTDFMRCLQHIVIDEDVVSLEKKKKKIEIAVISYRFIILNLLLSLCHVTGNVPRWVCFTMFT